MMTPWKVISLNFRAAITAIGEARCQGCQCSKKRIADPFINGHLTKLFSGQTDGAKDAVFPLSGHLIGEGWC